MIFFLFKNKIKQVRVKEKNTWERKTKKDNKKNIKNM